MGGATLAIGLLPTYAQIGVAAPILLVAMRVIQGFSLGGEFTGSMVYTTELASPLMRGLVSSSTAAGTTIGFILGSRIRVARQPHARAPTAVASWGWRIPFIASVVVLHRSAGSCAAASTSPTQGEKAAASAPPLMPSLARRLAADRADVRHRRDDERRVLPDVHVRRRAPQEPQRRRTAKRSCWRTR